jgi:hypothetical protein
VGRSLLLVINSSIFQFQDSPAAGSAEMGQEMAQEGRSIAVSQPAGPAERP